MVSPSPLSSATYLRSVRSFLGTGLWYGGGGSGVGNRPIWSLKDSYGEQAPHLISSGSVHQLTLAIVFISTFCTSSSSCRTRILPGSIPILNSSQVSADFNPRLLAYPTIQRRHFHDYFTTIIPPPRGSGQFLTTASPPQKAAKESPSAIVRIPLKGAKQHFGHIRSRGNRPYNEDWFQAGVLDLPRHLKTSSPCSLESKPGFYNPSLLASNSVFYYAAFDGHGGAECSAFLKDRLHEYIEAAAQDFYPTDPLPPIENPSATGDAIWEIVDVGRDEKPMDEKQLQQHHRKELQADLISQWKQTVGGYFRRFKPDFSGPSLTLEPALLGSKGIPEKAPPIGARGMFGVATGDGSWESILTYAFLRCDLDFITGKWNKEEEDNAAAEKKPSSTPEKDEEAASKQNSARLKSGSTASIALLFTP